MSTKRSTKKLPQEPIRVRDVRSVHEVEINLRPGGNRFVGANGAGKTTTVNCVLAAGGDKAALDALTPRDGTRRGRVEAFGVSITIGARRTVDGQPSVEVGGARWFGDLIRPTDKTAETRAKTRIKALLHFHPLPVDEEVLLRLCDGDTNVAAAVQANPAWEDLSLLDLAEKVRQGANALALGQEQMEAQKKGELSALLQDREGEGDWALEPGDVESLETVVEEKRLQLARMTVQAEGRSLLLRQQQEIRLSVGERPDLDDLEWQVGEAEEEVRELEEKLLAARAVLSSRRQALKDAEASAAEWDRRSAILSQPIEGPTEEEVAAVQAELARLCEDLENARACAEEQIRRERVRSVRREREDAEERARGYRMVAQGVARVVSELLSEHDLPGLTLDEGELAVVLPTGETRKVDDLSFGEQVRAAARIVLTAYRDSELPVIVAMAPEHWAALDHAHKAEVLTITEEEGIYFCFEESTEGDLRVEHVTASDLAAGKVHA